MQNSVENYANMHNMHQNSRQRRSKLVKSSADEDLFREDPTRVEESMDQELKDINDLF